MGKKWIWLIILLSVLVLAFLFPRVMLWLMEKEMEDSVLTYGTGTLLNFDSLTLGEKQHLMGDPNNKTILEKSLEDSEAESIQTVLLTQLELLEEYGALSPGFTEHIREESDDATIGSASIYGSSGEASFRFHKVSADSFHADIDFETGRLLSLGAYLDPRPDQCSWELFLRALAEYYDVVVTDLQLSPKDPPEKGEQIAGCKFTGNASVEFSYRIVLHEDGYWEMGPSPEG